MADMSETKPPPKPKKPAPPRAARLAAALKRNLKRRKAAKGPADR